MHDLPQDARVNLAREPDFSLGGAGVRPSTREIEFGDGRETIEPRVMQALVALARRCGAVVSRDELIQHCWEGRVVGEDAINRCLAKVRRITERMQGVALETVPRVGYRLVETAPEAPAATARRAPAWRARRKPLVWAGAVLVLLGIVAFFGYRLLSREERGPAPTFAVLPFTSLNSGEEMHLVGKSVAAATAAALNRVGMPLVSMAPYPAEARHNPADIGRKLGANYVISGSIRRDGDVVRAFARLDQVEGAVTVYSRMFEIPASAIDRLPDDVAGRMAGALTSTIAFITREPDPATKAGVLRALLSEDPRRGLEAARETLATAPGSGVAQLAFALRSQHIFAHVDTPELERQALIGPARAAAARARDLLPSFGETWLPECLLSPTATPAACEDLLRGALAADPQSPWLPTHLAMLLGEAGRLDEAGALRASAHATDPFQASKAAYYLYHLALSRDGRQLQSLNRGGRRYWDADPLFIALRFEGMVADGRMAEAEGLVRDPVAGPIIEPAGARQPIRSILAAHRTRAPADIDRARTECAADRLSRQPAVAACIAGLSATGDLATAFTLADRAFARPVSRSAEEAEAWFVKTGGNRASRAFLFGTAAAPMRSDPRFVALAGRTGLLDYWRARRGPDFCRQERAPVCERIRRRR
jgi:DNA-binding winged helix-turn-helix (wHTH) protein/TolB-like protein